MLAGLLRALLPRWNFFDRVSTPLTLEVRPVGATAWTSISFDAVRPRWGLFINPDVTLKHAQMSVLDTFVGELTLLIDSEGRVVSDRVRELTSYEMVRAIVFANVRERMAIQFRVGTPENVLFVSDSMVPQ